VTASSTPSRSSATGTRPLRTSARPPAPWPTFSNSERGCSRGSCSGDENALFHIANTFELRHLNERQKPDYNPAFLDWLFWWYLATVELTDRLLGRQEDSGPPHREPAAAWFCRSAASL
jgi:hypothetical protein